MIGINTQVQQSIHMNKTNQAEKVKAIVEVHEQTQVAHMTQMMSEIQSKIEVQSFEDSFEADYQAFQEFLSDVGYEGKAIATLSQDEAKELVSEEGFFGIRQTSERIAEFVLNGAKGSEEMLREGRKGVLQGLNEAEKVWDGRLPEISYETVNKTLEIIDKALIEGGFSIMDEKV